MNLRQVSVLEKMKIENALFCIISISDLGRSGRILEKWKMENTYCTKMETNFTFAEVSMLALNGNFKHNETEIGLELLKRNKRNENC